MTITITENITNVEITITEDVTNIVIQPLIKTFVNRRDTAANFTSSNPVLSAGEYGYETDTRKSKIGDGSTAWNDLGYLVADGAGSETANINTVIPLDTVYGHNCNFASANASTAYTINNQNIINAYARVLINAPSEPTITGANKEGGVTFVANTDMYMIVINNGDTGVKYYFTYVSTAAIVESVTFEQYGAVGDGITNDSAAVIEALGANKPIEGLDGKTYFVSNDVAITLTNNLTIFCNGKCTIKGDDTQTYDLFTINTNIDVTLRNINFDNHSRIFNLGTITSTFSFENLEFNTISNSVAEYTANGSITGSMSNLKFDSCADGIKLAGTVSNMNVENIEMTNFSSTGGCEGLVFGSTANPCNNVTIENVYAKTFTGTGLASEQHVVFLAGHNNTIDTIYCEAINNPLGGDDNEPILIRGNDNTLRKAELKNCTGNGDAYITFKGGADFVGNAAYDIKIEGGDDSLPKGMLFNQDVYLDNVVIDVTDNNSTTFTGISATIVKDQIDWVNLDIKSNGIGVKVTNSGTASDELEVRITQSSISGDEVGLDVSDNNVGSLKLTNTNVRSDKVTLLVEVSKEFTFEGGESELYSTKNAAAFCVQIISPKIRIQGLNEIKLADSGAVDVDMFRLNSNDVEITGNTFDIDPVLTTLLKHENNASYVNVSDNIFRDTLKVTNYYQPTTPIDTLIWDDNKHFATVLNERVIWCTQDITRLYVNNNYFNANIRNVVFKTGGANTTIKIVDNVYLKNDALLYVNTGSDPTNLIIRDNEDFKTANSGTASVSDGDTIAHGLVAAPTQYFVTSTDKGNRVSVTSVDATNLTVGVTDSSGAAVTIDFDVNWGAKVYNE